MHQRDLARPSFAVLRRARNTICNRTARRNPRNLGQLLLKTGGEICEAAMA